MKRLLFMPLALLAVAAGGAIQVAQDVCGPFTDVSPAICPFVLEMYYLGITAGTSPTTYSPNNPVTRGQAAVFVSKGVNQALARSSRRAALGQWWTTTPHYDLGIGTTGDALGPVTCDGADLWVGAGSGGIHRVRASDGRIVESWPGAVGGGAKISAMGRVFVARASDPGELYMIDPTTPPGSAVLVADNLGFEPQNIAFDGEKLWTANRDGSVSLIFPSSAPLWNYTNVDTGLAGANGIAFDGQNMWITEPSTGKIHKMTSKGTVQSSLTIGDGIGAVMFDGENLWITTCCGVSVVRRSDGSSYSFLQDPLLTNPSFMAFDGQRVMVLSGNSDGATLWNAATLQLIQAMSLGTGTNPQGVASDGINFWITLGNGQLARF